MANSSFSFQELREANTVEIPAPEFLEASDGIELAYRRYVPASPRAAVLFYHGGGAHSGLGYQHVGHGLQADFNTVVYTPDIRGHGASGGPHGDAPSPKQIWADISTFIRYIRAEYPQLPLFIGGHSSGAGLALNYAAQPDRESVSGYVFLSPQLGSRAQTDRPSLAVPFATVDTSAFIANAMSSGAAHGHDYAVQFNYPATLLASDPGLVGAITVNTSLALVPSAPYEQFTGLDRPFGLWIGSDDELFMPDGVLAFGDLAVLVRAESEVGSIPDAKHLSILLKAHEMIGSWLSRKLNEEDSRH